MLVNLSVILTLKHENEAIGCFNTPNIASLKAVIGAAEELNRPVIIAHAGVHEKFVPLEIIGPAMLAAAKMSKVPVSVLLDHAETPEYCYKAAELGFTAIMYDGSLLEYEENLETTKRITDAMHAKGISVEAELGTLKRHDTLEQEAASTKPDVYTDPATAEEFVNYTGVDALAIAIGAAHGIYFKEPVLDFNRLDEINSRIGTPLVMHGGSGISDDDYRSVISLGIEKINYYTYMSVAGGQAVKKSVNTRERVFFHDVELTAELAMKDHVRHAMKVFSHLE